jgi:hypothetical protein
MSSSNEQKVRHPPPRKRAAREIQQALHDQQLLEELDTKWSVGDAHNSSTQRHEQRTELSNDPIPVRLESRFATEGELNCSSDVARFAVFTQETDSKIARNNVPRLEQSGEAATEQGSKSFPHSSSDANV